MTRSFRATAVAICFSAPAPLTRRNAATCCPLLLERALARLEAATVRR